MLEGASQFLNIVRHAGPFSPHPSPLPKGEGESPAARSKSRAQLHEAGQMGRDEGNRGCLLSCSKNEMLVRRSSNRSVLDWVAASIYADPDNGVALATFDEKILACSQHRSSEQPHVPV